MTTGKTPPATDAILDMLARTKRQSAEATVDWRIGEAVCAIFKTRDTLTLSELIDMFERQAADSPSAHGKADPSHDGQRIVAEAVIRHLRGLRPTTTDAGSS